MRYLFEAASTTIVVLAVTTLIWAIAHNVVATQCERLGAFYVDSKVYECKLKEGK